MTALFLLICCAFSSSAASREPTASTVQTRHTCTGRSPRDLAAAQPSVCSAGIDGNEKPEHAFRLATSIGAPAESGSQLATMRAITARPAVPPTVEPWNDITPCGRRPFEVGCDTSLTSDRLRLIAVTCRSLGSSASVRSACVQCQERSFLLRLGLADVADTPRLPVPRLGACCVSERRWLERRVGACAARRRTLAGIVRGVSVWPLAWQAADREA